nr:PREDICTED: facilitated trehalose transporter Tret1-like isoform X1 [Bemisia tabaci]
MPGDESGDESSCFGRLPVIKYQGYNRSLVGILNQTVSSAVCCLSCFTIGLSIGWSSPAFHKIQASETSFTLDGFQQSLVVSALNIGIMFGAIPTSFLMDQLGRKKTLLYTATLSLLHWVLIAGAMNAKFLYFGRFLGGIYSGIATAIAPVYLAENLEPQIRGSIGTLFSILLYGGILCTYIIGPIASYMNLSLFCGAFTVLFMVTFAPMPETPYFCIIKNRREDARKSLEWLRGHSNVDAELKQIEAYVTSEQEHVTGWSDIFTDPNLRRPFLVCVALCFIQKSTGFFTIISYQSVILPGMVGPLTSEGATLVIGVVLLMAGTASAFLIDKVGRIILLNLSYVGVVLSMIPTALWFYFNKTDEPADVEYVNHYNWVPFFGFIAFIVCHAMGLGPVGNIYPGEVLPLSIKADAMALVVSLAALFTAINTEIFAFFNAYIGMYANYFSYAVVAVVGALFTRLYIVETKGKSLQAIQEEFIEQAKMPRMKGDYFVL